MISPASHAGGGNTNTTNAAADTHSGGDRIHPPSPTTPRLHLHLDQNSNKSGLKRRGGSNNGEESSLCGGNESPLASNTYGGGSRRSKDEEFRAGSSRHPPLSPEPYGILNPVAASLPLHHRQRGSPRSINDITAASPETFLTPSLVGTEFRPPWLPERTIVGRPWQPLPSSSSLLLYPTAPQSGGDHHSLGFAGPPPGLLAPLRGPLLLPPLDLARLAVGNSNGLLPPLGLSAPAGFPSPLLEQLYHQQHNIRPAGASSAFAAAARSSPLQHLYTNAPLLPRPSTSSPYTIPSSAKAPAETPKRKRPSSLLEDEDQHFDEGAASAALLSTSSSVSPAYGRSAKSRLANANRPVSETPCSSKDTGFLPADLSVSSVPGGSLSAAMGKVAGSPIVGVAAALSAPIMSARPAAGSSSFGGGDSGSSGISRPGHPAHFTQGSLIQLADGSLKRVEDLQTEDFLRSAEASADVRIDRSTVVRLERPPAADNCDPSNASSVLLTFSVGRACVQVRVEAALEHPFYVFERGWASCAPELTLARYQLACRPLQVGDVCISLTHKAAFAPTAAGTHASTASFLTESGPLPMPTLAGSPAKSASQTGKQVAFQEVPSIYRINTDSPPNQRSSPIACSSPLPPSLFLVSAVTGSATWTKTTKSSVAADGESPPSTSTEADRPLQIVSGKAMTATAAARRTLQKTVEDPALKPKTTC